MNGFDLNYTASNSGNSYTGLFTSTESLVGFLEQIASLGVNDEKGEKKEVDYLEKPSLAVSLAADSHGTMIATANILSKTAGKALKTLSATGTVVGVISGGVPAAYNIISNIVNGKGQKWNDWVGLGLAGLGIASEFFGVGELYDGTVGLTIAATTLSYDIYSAATLK